MTLLSNETGTMRDHLAAVMRERKALPAVRATYRLQFNHTWTFNRATALVPYLADLGISHIYASPIFTAAPGSMHGYNVVNYGEINPEVGTREEFDRLVSELHRNGMGMILDFVPNHMGIESGANPWWQDVLENGSMSRYAEYFDIDWTPLKRELRGKVLLPFLGGQYGEVLERSELALTFVDGGFVVNYYDTPFPVDPRTYPIILRRALERIEPLMAPDDLDLLEFQSVITALDHLPHSDDDEPDRETIDLRAREQVVARRRLTDLSERNVGIHEAIATAVHTLNGTLGDPRSFDDLDALLIEQNYRLSYWRVAAEEINYRRFFAINSLAAIRQEDDPVFADTHRLLIDLLADGAVDGVRFDHPDGLWDPEKYFRDVQVAYLREAVRRRVRPENDDVWDGLLPELDEAISHELETIGAGSREWPVWVVGEKILEHGENLPECWQIAGTVGYEFAQATTGLFVDPAARIEFDRLYSRFTGDKVRFPELVYEMKRTQMREAFPSEMNVLTNILNRISENDRHSRDFTIFALRSALREIMANFAVYRTYTTCSAAGVTDHDAKTIQSAVRLAKRKNPQSDPSVFDFLESVLLLHTSDSPRQRRDMRCHFAMKMQQLTGPVMAKGLEDTAFYRFSRLVSLNEVGGDPAKFGTSVDEFHKQNRARQETWPTAMITSSTHDTKRAEDVRARISVVSEMPSEFRAAANRWTRANRKHKAKIEGALAPHRVDEWVIYQTLIGTWPLGGRDALSPDYTARIQEYMVKVAREASRFSNWVNPDSDYESALRTFIGKMLDPKASATFLQDFQGFIDQVLPIGLVNAMSQHVLKLTSPGVPDLYQGTEMWDDSLVDPDNRRDVDFELRRSATDDLTLDPDWRSPAGLRDGRAKAVVTARLLNFRREHRELFSAGEYVAADVSGAHAGRVVAFLRRGASGEVLVVAPRLVRPLLTEGGLDWADTSIRVESGRWRSVLDDRMMEGAELPIAELLASIPVGAWFRERDRKGQS